MELLGGWTLTVQGPLPLPRRHFLFVGAASFLGACIAGETVALHALLHGPPGEEGREWVEVALVVGTGLLFNSTMLRLMQAFDERLSNRARRAWLATYNTGYLIALILVVL
jgi:hypothetical protein